MGTTSDFDLTEQPALPFDLDAGVGARAAIGLIVLSSDQTIEHEFKTLLDLDGVALYQSRIRNDSRITPETLAAMEARLVEATDVIIPDMPLDVVAFACTSASMVIGEERVFEKIRKARPHTVPTTPITAAFAAFKAFGARRIALLTPYRPDVNHQIRAYIEARGVETGWRPSRRRMIAGSAGSARVRSRRRRSHLAAILRSRRCSFPARPCALHRWLKRSRPNLRSR